MRPSVSILTPTYNQEKYISQCIESVLAQTSPDWEMLIVDDGSNDGTCDKVRSYKDERIVLLRQDHVGIWKLRETYGRALARARGHLLAVLDGDDWWPKEKLEIQTPAFRDGSVALSFGSFDCCDADGRYFRKGHLPASAVGRVAGNRVARLVLEGRLIPYSVTVMVRKSAIDQIGGFVQPEYLPLVDVPTWLNVALGRYCVGFREMLGCYRVHSGSVCRTLSSDTEEGHMRYCQEFLIDYWRDLGFSEKTYADYQKYIESRHDHIRGVTCIHKGKYAQGIGMLRKAFSRGSWLRKAKALVRIMQCIVMFPIFFFRKDRSNPS